MAHNSSWKIRSPAPVNYLAEMSFCPPLISHILFNRGIKDAAEAKSFLQPGEEMLFDPYLLADMEKAVARIRKAIDHRERIVVWGDFDTDGISGTALLVEGLTLLGACAAPYIPRRMEEGYGLNTTGIKGLRDEGVQLIITVDCGISSREEVAFANQVGLEVIITDHHAINADLPEAEAVVNPKRHDSKYPFTGLAGVGVAYKVLQALAQSMSRNEVPDKLLELVALGTVADMVPLCSENRYLVKRGLEILNRTERAGLKAMITASRLVSGKLDTESISYYIGPRLNTIGRFSHALPAYQLLVTRDAAEAQDLADKLEKQNAERKRITEDVWQKAKGKVIIGGLNDRVLFVDGADYHPGVLGLVAGRIVDEFHRPAMVVNSANDVCRGSARSIESFNFFNALTECREYLIQFGGHAMAAGFTASRDQLELLHHQLCGIADIQMTEKDLVSELLIDVETQLPDLNEEVLSFWRKLAPFGKTNGEPIFLSCGVSVIECRGLGQNADHLKLKMRDGDAYWDGIAFNMGRRVNDVGAKLDIVYQLAVDNWNNRESIRLNLLDFKPSVT